MNICWGEPQFPYKVTADGGIYVFKKRPENRLPDREVPDTFALIGSYAEGSPARAQLFDGELASTFPGLIRGHEASLIMVEHGRFEGFAPHITVRPEKRVISAEYKAEVGRGGHQDPGRRNQHHAGARRQLPAVHAHASEADARCRDRRQGAGADHDGGAVVPRRPRPVLRREDLEGFAEAV